MRRTGRGALAFGNGAIMMKIVLALATVAATFAAPTAAAVNLVINGGFEAPALDAGGYFAFGGGGGITGWVAPGASVATLDGAYSEGGHVFNANSGDNAMELTGLGNTGPTAQIRQTVETGSGSYLLRFFVGNASATGTNGAVYTQPSTVNLSINGGAIQSFTNSSETPFAVNWRQFSLAFAAAGPTEIVFLNGTSLADNYLGLDDVSVTAVSVDPVPEPASWALLFTGFGLVGTAMRRRASAALLA